MSYSEFSAEVFYKLKLISRPSDSDPRGIERKVDLVMAPVAFSVLLVGTSITIGFLWMLLR